MKQFKGSIWYLLINIAAFHILPVFIKDSAGAISLLLTLFPMLTMALSICVGTKFGFVWLYPILIVIGFVPSIFLFYNSSAWIYAFLYGGISFLFVVLGYAVNKRRQRQNHNLNNRSSLK